MRITIALLMHEGKETWADRRRDKIDVDREVREGRGDIRVT